MTTLLSRPISLLEMGVSEQEQDPNSALLELDRGTFFCLIWIIMIPNNNIFSILFMGTIL